VREKVSPCDALAVFLCFACPEAVQTAAERAIADTDGRVPIKPFPWIAGVS
jgi:hypothetical protein